MTARSFFSAPPPLVTPFFFLFVNGFQPLHVFEILNITLQQSNNKIVEKWQTRKPVQALLS
jgi:hypothetical protein